MLRLPARSAGVRSPTTRSRWRSSRTRQWTSAGSSCSSSDARPARRCRTTSARAAWPSTCSSSRQRRAGHHRPRRRRDHHRPRRDPRRLPRAAAGAPRRAVPHDARATSATRSATTTSRSWSTRRAAGSTSAVTLFGDERASYADALDRHYRVGAPDGWEAIVHLRVRHDASVGGLRRDASPTTCTSPTRWRRPPVPAWCWTPTGSAE